MGRAWFSPIVGSAISIHSSALMDPYHRIDPPTLLKHTLQQTQMHRSAWSCNNDHDTVIEIGVFHSLCEACPQCSHIHSFSRFPTRQLSINAKGRCIQVKTPDEPPGLPNWLKSRSIKVRQRYACKPPWYPVIRYISDRFVFNGFL